jgi:ketosteroid isomerase-like protein
MSESRVETVRLLFERFDSTGLERALELISEDFVAEVPGSLSAEPDVYEGHDGARRYFAGFDGLMEDVRFEPIDIFEEGDAVIVLLRLSGRGAVSGIEVEQRAAVVTWVRDGKVTRMQPFPDLDAAREAIDA